MKRLLLSWALSTPAFAQNAWDPVSDVRPGSMEALARDLESTDVSRRGFAIRELNRVARLSRKSEFGSLEDARTVDALSNLDFLDEVIAPICIQHVSRDVELVRCGRLLARLETGAARTVLMDARARTESSRTKKRLSRSIAILDRAAEEQ